jgi:hypothetical protein
VGPGVVAGEQATFSRGSSPREMCLASQGLESFQFSATSNDFLWPSGTSRYGSYPSTLMPVSLTAEPAPAQVGANNSKKVIYMGRDKRRRSSERDPGGFSAIPWAVIDCEGFKDLSHPARALLLEFARQLGPYNNGRLLCTREFMTKRGWTSWDVVHRAKHALLGGGFIHETVKGARPNKASWYAVTWHALAKCDGYDVGSAETFIRGAYRAPALMPSRGKTVPLVRGADQPSTIQVRRTDQRYFM